ncbi:MAG TPA: ATP-binding protein, partial [Mycobacteriales bacterium]|nr:ATP-binding protein [Mycobacteriales bacterium]
MENNEELSVTVLRMADADPELPKDAGLLVLAAMTGDGLLGEALAEEPGGTGGVPPVRPPTPDEPAGQPVGAFLSSIEVTGFRGIGKASTLSLRPKPGLTIVAGRNGSGKSSFAEALEVALTGNSYRWKTKSVLFKDAWRNLHQPTGAGIQVRIAEEGRTKATTVGVDWAADGGLDDRKVWVQRHGQPREAGLESLGWGLAMDLFRPILSYDELGGLMDAGPSTLYEKLAGILGLDQLTGAQDRLDAAIKRLGEPRTAEKTLRAELKNALAAMDDPRAARVLTLLAKRTPDVDALRQLATGTAQPVNELTRLRALAELPVPAEAEVTRVAGNLRVAVDAVASTADGAAE